MKPYFAMYTNGFAEIDIPTVEKIAKERDAMQPFFCKAILLLQDMLVSGQLKDRTPDELIIGLTRKEYNG